MLTWGVYNISQCFQPPLSNRPPPHKGLTRLNHFPMNTLHSTYVSVKFTPRVINVTL